MPAPPQIPLSTLAQTRRFMRDPYGFLAWARAECGEIFSVRLLGMGQWVFLCNAQLLDQLYKMPEEQVLAGEIRKKMVGYLFGEQASICLDGEQYAVRRKLLTPFFSGRGVLQHSDEIRELTEAKMTVWPDSEPFAMQPHFSQITLEVAARVLFGPLDQEPGSTLLPLAERFFLALQPPAVQVRLFQWNLGPWTPWGRFVAARRDLYEGLADAVRSRQRDPSPERDDALSALVAAELYESEEECRTAIVHEMVASVVGGAETTAKVLSWTLHGVLSKPHIRQQLEQELDEVLGDRPIRSEDLRQLPYLHAVIQEGMRYQSVGPFAGPRLVKKDIEIEGFTITAGTGVAQCLQEAGRSDFFPKPEEFDPENFFGRKVKPRDWAPFGGGARICTGMGLAQLELAIVVGTIVRSFELELLPGPTHPVRSGIAFQPANGLMVKVARRRGPS